ncbi:hypothetical protein [Paraburkholderia sp. J67]|uniref:hypothetical protein n=1 Tax=Paraburkholderia sp. J67 TaxID=2805435 RepID=UPI002ABD5DC7|nr:hypothetical protein [Paraburkholderia sp. J67]
MFFTHSMEKNNHPDNPTLLRLAPTTFAVAYALTARNLMNFMWDKYRGRCSDIHTAEPGGAQFDCNKALTFHVGIWWTHLSAFPDTVHATAEHAKKPTLHRQTQSCQNQRAYAQPCQARRSGKPQAGAMPHLSGNAVRTLMPLA